MKHHVVGLLLWILLASILSVPSVFCLEPQFIGDADDAAASLINILRRKGVLSATEAAALLARQEQQKQMPVAQERTITIIPEGQTYLDKISTNVARDIKKDVQARLDTEMKSYVNEMESGSSWKHRIRWGGDIRLRYQGDRFDELNAILRDPDDTSKIMNTTEDRDRGRIRVRLAVKAKINENVEAGVKIATGNERDPVSSNDTFGDYQNSDDVVLLQAYLKWNKEMDFWDRYLDVALWGGRIPNPWFSSSLVWDVDLNFEGAALQINPKFNDNLSGFMTIGAFPLQEVELSQNDKWLYGGQLGVNMTTGKNVNAQFGVAYYDYENTVGKVNPLASSPVNDWTAPLYQQKGNTLMDINPALNTINNLFIPGNITTALASEFTELNITSKLDLAFFDPVHVIFLADYVRNLAFDRKEVMLRAGLTESELPEDLDEGYQFGCTVGHPKVRSSGAWKVFFTYKYLEADAVLDAFTDSDFHLGGTNAKGWIMGADYGLADNFWLTAKWLSSDEIDGPQIAIDTLMLDLNAEF
ncbi:MAG: putative porin [Thermodesulfobacteriota bacterium]|nr:putative porin [Thermodesulfobacteriota bacterium]